MNNATDRYGDQRVEQMRAEARNEYIRTLNNNGVFKRMGINRPPFDGSWVDPELEKEKERKQKKRYNWPKCGL